MINGRLVRWSALSVMFLFSLYVPVLGQAPAAPKTTCGWASNGPQGGYIYAVAEDPLSPKTVYAGSDGDGVFKSVDDGESWTAVNTGLDDTAIRALAVNPVDTQKLYCGTYNAGVYKSEDGGDSWTAVNTGITTNTILALVINPQHQATIYAATNGGGIFKTTDGGDSWSATNNGITDTYVYALAVDPQAGDIVYAGTLSDGVFKSTNGGASWGSVSTGISSGGIDALAVDPKNSDTVYAGTYGGGIYKSINGGSSWSSANSGLSDVFIYCLAVDPKHTSNIYAGSKNGGVFQSTDGGAGWSSINTNLENLDVLACAVNPDAPSIVWAGTFGNGAFRYGCGCTMGSVAVSVTPDQGQAPLDVTGTASATSYECMAAPSYAWDWGDGASSSGASVNHTYATEAAYHWMMTVTLDTQTKIREGDVNVVPPYPVISSIVKKHKKPFRLTVSGTNLQKKLKVYIDGTLWGSTTNNKKVSWKSTEKIVIKKGSALKTAVPKNTPVEFRIVNPDGGEGTYTYQRPEPNH